MKKHLLVTLANENYINQAKQLFSSAYFNGGWDGDYLLLAHEIPENKLKWFKNKGIFIKNCKRLHRKSKIKLFIFKTIDWTLITLSKFYLFTLYFKNWDNILFLDSDIIVEASLKGLKNKSGFWACPEIFPKLKDQFIDQSKLDQNNNFLLNKIKDKYNLESAAFNSGVMAFKTDIIKNDTFAKLKNLCLQYRNITQYGEEGILNICFYNQWQKLSLAYNFLSCVTNITDFKTIINHTNHTKKAWHSDSPYYLKWMINLKRSNLIDIKNPRTSENKLPKLKIIKYSQILETYYRNLIKFNADNLNNLKL